MQRPGLYFPFILVRDDDWLKTAALYWPSVRRLVPSAIPSTTVRLRKHSSMQRSCGTRRLMI